MKVLVIGGGGREHALAWKLAQSARVSEVLVAPGNAGTATEPRCRNVEVAAEDVPGLLRLAQAEGVGFTVVGPEGPLAAGVVDAFKTAGLRVFGPTQAAAQIEASKAFTKDFLARHRIPTAQYRVFTEAEPALAYVAQRGAPIVVKADGLAAGKGVVVAESVAEAQDAIRGMFAGSMGQAGARVVIEDFLVGEEASYIVVAAGTHYVPLASAQDHKRVFDGDQGPNTGGMGTYSPAPILTPELTEQARTSLVEAAMTGIAAEGAPYRGALFCEMMLTPDGPKLVEFNARFGDPECQVLMLRLESDLVPYLMAAATGRLADLPAPAWRAEAAICVVLAADGYPGAPKTGSIIRGAEADLGEDVTVFHAGTERNAAGELVASGGRVLNVCALGATLAQARERAYAAIGRIDWPEGFCRTDIAARALAK